MTERAGGAPLAPDPGDSRDARFAPGLALC